MHGTIMLLLFGTPMAIGLANYIVPLQIGAADMAFPRLNALSFWLFLFGALVVLSSFLVHGGPAAVGWTGYAPLSERDVRAGVGRRPVDRRAALTGISASSARSTSSRRSTAGARPGCACSGCRSSPGTSW